MRTGTRTPFTASTPTSSNSRPPANVSSSACATSTGWSTRSGDYDRDGVSNLDEAGDVYSLAAAQTDPFGYPDEDTATDADADGLPDAWELYRFGTLAHAPTDTDAAGRSYADLYTAQKRDTDGDGLPDDWEKFRCGGTLAENASTVHDGKTNLARFHEDRVKLAEHRYGAQVFRYDAGWPTNAFSSAPESPLKVFLKGNQGGSMIVTYSDDSYGDILSIQVWPSNEAYGDVPPDREDPATHRADYTGSRVNGVRVYGFSATPATGTYVARDLLRSLDGHPLGRVVLSGAPRLRFAPLAITSLPLAQCGPTTFPIILRDFPYDTVAFPDFGNWASSWIREDFLEASLDGGPTTGVPSLRKDALLTVNNGQGVSGHGFACWYSHPDAFGFNLPATVDPANRQGFRYGEFFPHRNDVGSRLGGAFENSHGFTVEAHFWLDYDLASTRLDLFYDDDLWVFIDGRLAVDKGGLHWQGSSNHLLQDLRANVKARDGASTPFLETQTGSCRVDIFYAERQIQFSSLGIQANASMHPIYAYQVVAEADLATTCTYSLTQAPAGMSIDSRSGRIFWDYWGLNHDSDPANDVAAGAYLVTVSVSDARGYTATQSFTLQLSSP